MSIQMSLVFGVLITEMVVLFIYLLPMPFIVRQKLVDGAAAVRRNTNFKVALVFSTVLMSLQFMDCLKKLKRYAHTDNPYFAQNAVRGSDMLYDQLALKFYAQRNLYITGAVLYLGLSINTVVLILRDLVSRKAELRKLLLATRGSDATVVEHLRKEVHQRELDLEIMKKQLSSALAAYDSLTPLNERTKDD